MSKHNGLPYTGVKPDQLQTDRTEIVMLFNIIYFLHPIYYKIKAVKKQKHISNIYMCSVSRTVNLEMTSNSAALEFSSSKMA